MGFRDQIEAHPVMLFGGAIVGGVAFTLSVVGVYLSLSGSSEHYLERIKGLETELFLHRHSLGVASELNRELRQRVASLEARFHELEQEISLENLFDRRHSVERQIVVKKGAELTNYPIDTCNGAPYRLSVSWLPDRSAALLRIKWGESSSYSEAEIPIGSEGSQHSRSRRRVSVNAGHGCEASFLVAVERVDDSSVVLATGYPNP